MSKPLVHKLYAQTMSGQAIETESFATIDREAPAHSFSPSQWEVVRRLIHTSADFRLMDEVKFSADAVCSAVAALKAGRPIYTDSNMIRAGLSIARLKSVNAAYNAQCITCYVADEQVAEEAQKSNLPRSLFAVRKAKSLLDGGIALFGNAPVGLLELNRLIIEENVRPALVVAMPVGFVHVVESKEESMSLGVPFIALAGRRGGSPLAVAALHALCSLAKQGS